MAEDERDLLDRCIEGDRRAWDAFVRQYTRYVYYLVQLTARRCSARLSEDEVADLHNDLFMALLEDDCRRLRAFGGRNGCSVRSWVRIITIRRTLDHFRRRKVHISLDATDASGRPLAAPITDDAPDALEQLIDRADAARRAQLDALAASLSDTDRLLLELAYVRKLPTETIAATLATSRGAVYTRKTRLIKRLRALAAEAGLLESNEV